MLNNPLFCSILLITSVLQCLIVQFGSVAFSVAEGGLDGPFWGLSLAFGAGSLFVQKIINVVYAAGLNFHGYRNKKRLKKDRSLATHGTGNDGTGSVVEHEHGHN